jgi:glutathione S-transferase
VCTYLADAFPQANLAPPTGDKLRGPYYRWMFFAAGPFEAMTSNHSLGFEVPDDKRAMIGYGSRTEVIDTMEHAVSRNEYLLGGRFSAADVYLGSQIGWGLLFGTLEKRPAFVDYFARISNRPAAVRANEIDDALIAAAKSS